MPPSMERGWSTQYKDDYHQLVKHHIKPPCLRKPATRVWSKRIPAATKISAFSYRTAHGKSVKPDRQEHNTVTGNEDTDQNPDLAQNGSNSDNQGSIQSPRDINVLGQAIKTAKPDAEPLIPQPETLRTNTPVPKNLHWSCWPQPIPKEKKRPKTSLGFYREEEERNAEIENRGPPGVDPEFYGEDLLNEYQIPANDTKMMPQISRSNTFHYEPQGNRLTSITVNDPPARDTYTMYNQPRRSQSVTPTGHYNQSFFPYHKAGGAGVREDMVVNSFAKAMEGKQPLPNNYQYSFHKYPFTTRQPRKVALGDQYQHQFSTFTLTTPRCTGHFIIHPDWVSERSGMKRSRSFIQQSKKNMDGLRY